MFLLYPGENFLAKNDANDMRALRERLDRINSWYVDVKSGDSYELRYHPESGTTLVFNGTDVGTIEGDDFARAIFGIWLSDVCIDKSFRDKLLGK